MARACITSFKLKRIRGEIIRRRQVKVPYHKAPLGTPGAQAVSFVALMEVAVTLAAQRRRVAGDAVFLDVTAMSYRPHS